MNDQQTHNLLHLDLTSLILNSCFEVMKEHGIGFLEQVYKNSLFISLKEKGLAVETEKSFDVFFKQQKVGFYRADIVVENSVIVEVKCCSSILPEHLAQLINYLKATGTRVGLLVNFGGKRLEYRRVYHPDYKP